jgi:LysM repeat protein
MPQTATVVPAGLNLRPSASTTFPRLGVLIAGDQVTIVQRVGKWFQVESELGSGFVASEFVKVNEGGTPISERAQIPDDLRTEVRAPASIYRVRTGDTLSKIGQMLGVRWQALAKVNGIPAPYTIHVNQPLLIPDAGTPPIAVRGEVAIDSPLAAPMAVTTSSATGHHRPYGGTHSADIDVLTISSGAPALFNVSSTGLKLRGVVQQVRPACATGNIADGGWQVRIAIEVQMPGANWTSTDVTVVYAHMDPVAVTPGSVLMPGDQIGQLGPPAATPPVIRNADFPNHLTEGPPRDSEYHSSCAVHSHLHVEVTRGLWVAGAQDDLTSVPLFRVAV